MQCCNGSDVIGKGKEGAEKDNGQDRAYTYCTSGENGSLL
jgi:hypothetical protein